MRIDLVALRHRREGVITGLMHLYLAHEYWILRDTFDLEFGCIDLNSDLSSLLDELESFMIPA